jgi:hypothetical protein
MHFSQKLADDLDNEFRKGVVPCRQQAHMAPPRRSIYKNHKYLNGSDEGLITPLNSLQETQCEESVFIFRWEGLVMSFTFAQVVAKCVVLMLTVGGSRRFIDHFCCTILIIRGVYWNPALPSQAVFTVHGNRCQECLLLFFKTGQECLWRWGDHAFSPRMQECFFCEDLSILREDNSG